MLKAQKAGEKRNEKANKNRCERVIDVGGLVLLKVPGLCGSLEASWKGPYKVVRKLSKVYYMVKKKGSN